MKKSLKAKLNNILLSRYTCEDVEGHERLNSDVLVESYTVNEKGETVLSPVPENKRFRVNDGKSCELSSLMYGTMPETLIQIDTNEQIVRADKVTSSIVRRFGKLNEQREKLIEKSKENNE